MKRKREDEAEGNLVTRIFRRASGGAPAGATVAQSRRLYENIVPSEAVLGVEPPPGFCVCRFTPCGQYLVSFDEIRNEVVVHRFQGLHFSAPGDGSAASSTAGASTSAPQPGAQGGPGPPLPHRFEDAFAPHVRCSVGAGPEEQLFSFCLVVHEAFLIVASSTPDTRPMDADGWLGVSDSTTIYLIRLSDGALSDRILLHADCMELAHNSGASLWEDLLVVLALATQALYVLRITPAGRFVFLYSLGEHCRDDDALVLTQQEEGERRWRAQQEGAGLRVPSASAIPAAGASPILHGLKQRMLTRLYLRAAEESAAAAAGDGAAQTGQVGGTTAAVGADGLPVGRHALNSFYYFFSAYADMKMARVQLLNRELLLVHWVAGPAIAGMPRSTSAGRGLAMIFHMGTTRVERIFLTSSPEYTTWAAGTAALAHGGSPCSDWERFLAPGAWSMARRLQDPRHSDAHAPGCQTRQSSPYLDPDLYQYDDRFVSADAYPRHLPHRAAKFVARAWPERLRFKFDADHVRQHPPPAPQQAPAHAPAASDGAQPEADQDRALAPGAVPPPPPEAAAAVAGHGNEEGSRSELEVVYLFHPMQPFVLAVVEDAETGAAERISIFTRL